MKAKLNSCLTVWIIFVVFNLACVSWTNFAINNSMLLSCGVNVWDRTFKTFSARTDRSYQNCDGDYFFHTTKI